jgi:hypothetical protein
MATYGSCTTSVFRKGRTIIYKWDWLAEGAGGNQGKVSGVGALSGITGEIIGCGFVPDSGDTQPTDQYDVTLLTTDGFDMLGGKGANLSNSAGTRTVPVTSDKTLFRCYNETLTPEISGAGASNGGELYLFVSERQHEVVAGFSPAKISNLVGWWPAYGITGLSDDDVIGTFPDQSGNGNDLTQATAGKKPLYKVNVKNGYPTVRFDGADDYLQGAFGATIAQPVTYFIALRIITAASNKYIMAGDDATNRVDMYSDSSTNCWSVYAGGGVVSLTVVDTNWHYVIAIFNGASSSIRLDGSAIRSGNVGTNSLDGLTLGAYSTGANNMNLDMIDSGVYSKVVSGAELTALESYLAAMVA